MEDRDSAANRIYGELTFTDLTEIGDLFRPQEADAWGVRRTPFSPVMARLSAEIAADGYVLDIKPWMAAGWDDCTFIVEDRVVVLDRDSDSRLAAIEGEWRRRRARSLMTGVNPISDVKRAIRQLLVTDLGKEIIMTRMLPDGRAVIAISFIGTTQKYFDWFSNFKFQQDTGMHFGFLSLARRFDTQATRIMLPKLAAAMGEETFTLADAILEAQKPDSRISFWLSGHSQGGAIAQIYTHLLREQGVELNRIHTYTFAAPTVASSEGCRDPKSYPVYNIISMDDVVPRIGAQLRLGLDYIYRPSEAFRKRHYRVEEDMDAAFSRAMYINQRVQTTREAIHFGIALMRLLRDTASDTALEGFFAEFLPHLAAVKHINLEMPEIADFLESTLTNQLKGLTEEFPDEALCEEYQGALRSMLDTFGPKATTYCINKALGAPHHIRPDKHDDAYESPYIAISRRHLGECEQGVWTADDEPRCLTASGEVLLPRRYTAALLPEGRPPQLPEQDAFASSSGDEGGTDA